MNILKDLVAIGIFITSLFVLYKTIDHYAALFCVITIIIMYLVKYFKLKRCLQEEIKYQKEYFVETLIHDLKVPTIAQLRGLELLQNEFFGGINSEQKEMIEQIAASCKHMLNMISMMQETYKYETGDKKFVLENFNIADLVIESFEEVSNTAKEKNVEFVYEPISENLPVRADRSDIKTVITNLLYNSIVYSNRNEKIIVTTSSDKNGVSIEISLHGLPFSKEECKTMFGKSKMESPTYTTIGRSISLYLCKKIIESHNGIICAGTDGKAYNVFKVLIPLSSGIVSKC